MGENRETNWMHKGHTRGADGKDIVNIVDYKTEIKSKTAQGFWC